MASTYSNLKIELIGTGEQVGTWGATTNTNLGTALEEAIVGSADVAFSSSDVTLTLTNTNGSQAARHIRLNLTGTSGGARQLILGSGCQIDKPYIINNGLADAVTVKNTSGTGVVVPAGKSMWVFNNGTNVVEVQNFTSVASGGTGLSTLTANNVILGNGTSAVQFVAPGSNGNVLTSNGTTWVSSTPPASGTVTSVSGTGTVQGLTLTGTVTSSGSLTLGGSLSAVDLTSQVTGTLPTANGGTGNTSGTVNALSTASGSAPSYSARAWVNFNGEGTPAIRQSGNVASITDNGAGDYTINFSTNLEDGQMCLVGTASATSTSTNPAVSGKEAILSIYATSPFSSSSARFRTNAVGGDGQYGGSPADRAFVCVAVFR